MILQSPIGFSYFSLLVPAPEVSNPYLILPTPSRRHPASAVLTCLLQNNDASLLNGIVFSPTILMRFCPILLVAIANILGRALMTSAAGANVVLQLPGGTEYLTVLEV